MKVSEMLDQIYGIKATTGSKIICPLCGRNTFIIKRYFSIGTFLHAHCRQKIVEATEYKRYVE
ncbi:hypothetical protein E8P77_16265 [Soehngenia saccharolytica]|nr:hypothetical protein E8P77_16265 [Soehngenia saccharolytica]